MSTFDVDVDQILLNGSWDSVITLTGGVEDLTHVIEDATADVSFLAITS